MNILSSILDAIFPPKCIVCDGLLGGEKEAICVKCNSKVNWLETPFFSPDLGEIYFDSALSLAAYDGVWMDVVHNLKYNRRTDLAKPLSLLLSHKVNYEYDLIVPVPLHVKRLRSRGYNQSALLAKELAKLCGFRANLLCLKRVKGTLDQVGLSKKERMENMKGAFHSGAVSGDILLIDDVMTTGSTINECAKTLKKCGAGKIDVLTLART